jgi:hypothetical protein
MATSNGKKKFGLFAADDVLSDTQLEQARQRNVSASLELVKEAKAIEAQCAGESIPKHTGELGASDQIEVNSSKKNNEPSSAKSPIQIWTGDFIKRDKDTVEIYRYDENQPATERLVAVVILVKGQNISEITD